ncbi:choice-of-anchor G family protein [Naasia sp. SYSU D00948]|uniref:choice-of-anchor G family protein n=1 Tax=Naasia sp. SYSU D00948 TaxID=2817379 RepID=UPI001B304D91|nr:choice-of-anchor G family protein [Naasia sp. SYSU D00948]
MPRRSAALLAAGTAALVVLAGTVSPTTAAWVVEQYDRGTASTLDCASGAAVDGSAWSQVIGATGPDPVPALPGLSVTNIAPGLESTPSDSAAVSLGADGWSSTVDIAALDPSGGTGLAAGAGLYSQVARATAGGLSVAAAGAVTAAADGAVALDTAAPASSRSLTLRLSEVLAPVLAGAGSAVEPDELADVRLTVGALGARARYDSCPVLWSPSQLASHLSRSYLLTDLTAGFDSSAVRTAVATLDESLAALQTQLNALRPPGTPVTGAALTTVTQALTSALRVTVLGIPVQLGRVDSVTAGTAFDLTAARSLLTGTISDGSVTIDLATGRITADLDSIFAETHHTSRLNGLAPNSKVLTPEVLAALSTRVGALLTGFVDGALSAALDTAITSASTVVDTRASLDVILAPLVHANALALTTRISGSLGSFLGTAGEPRPAVASTVTVLNGLLSAVLTPLLVPLAAAIEIPMATTVASAVGSAVLAGVSSSASQAATSTTQQATHTTVPALLTALRPALDALRRVVDVTANAQPDSPGGVDPPAPAVEGRYMVSALNVAALDLAGSRLLSVHLASAAVGPNAKR